MVVVVGGREEEAVFVVCVFYVGGVSQPGWTFFVDGGERKGWGKGASTLGEARNQEHS
jgi:hypothetical protein